MKSFVIEHSYRIGEISESNRIVIPFPKWLCFTVAGLVPLVLVECVGLLAVKIAQAVGWL